MKDVTFVDPDGVAVLEAIVKYCKKKEIIISFVCLSNVMGFEQIDKGSYFRANVNDSMTDNGAYTRDSYSLDPMKDLMRNIGFAAAHSRGGNDDYKDVNAMEMADAAPAEIE
jgi:hypothetical protein